MRAPHWVRVGLTALGIVAASVAFPVGCGEDNALVGGECTQGYFPCGGGCCLATDASLDAKMPDTSSDALLRGDGDGSTTDGSRDGAPLTDGTLPDGETEEGSTGDGSTGDGSTGDGSTGDGATGDGSNGDGSSGDGGPGSDAEAGILCTPPLVDCSGVCVDLTSDPFNCGRCGNVCPSVICEMSKCVGATTGGIVYIGHDYLTTNAATSQAHVLTNAVFIPQNNPLKILSYERYGNATAVTIANNIVRGAATAVGRSATITSTVTDSDIPSKLTLATFQVLIVHDQSTAPTGALATLGASWASTLTTFTAKGGVVVVLDGGTGIGQMPQFSTSTTLLSVTSQATLKVGTPLTDESTFDVVGEGVVSPYGAGKNSVTITTEPNGGNVIYVIEDVSDAGPSAPVVVHKVF